MKLTDSHVSDNRLNELIECYENLYSRGTKPDFIVDVINAFLEIKQRRAEDRAKEAGDGE
jgi:hypothetical protein